MPMTVFRDRRGSVGRDRFGGFAKAENSCEVEAVTLKRCEGVEDMLPQAL